MVQQYWRQAGFTYLRYANLCATILRTSLKEPFKSQALARENVQASVTQFAHGKEVKKVIPKLDVK